MGMDENNYMTTDDLVNQFHYLQNLKFESAKVLVVGDVMIDRYWFGDTFRISPEAPVPVVKVENVQDRLGGAANVALNVRALGAQVQLIGIMGNDEAGDRIQHLLDEHRIQHDMVRESIYTITKLRVLGRSQQLLRCDFEQDFSKYQNQLLERVKKALPQFDLVILSDYAKGTLAPVQAILQAAQQLKKPVLVDPKSKDFSIYRGAYLITPNFGEFEQAVGHCKDEASIEHAAQGLLNKGYFENLLVTRGAKGMSLFQKAKPTWSIPTQAQEIYDVTGAGDTVIAVLGAALAAQCPLNLGASLANLAAGLVIKHLGTAAVTRQELLTAIQNLQGPQEISKVIDEDEALKQITRAKAKGEKIVMTNGCFDILHAGHVTYLKQARRLGARLIVAVNDDASVKRLKGPSRPINTLEHRMDLLASLECVDWVISFSEDTPKRIIEKLVPNILVKGGDYQPHEVVGGDCVRAHGGQVVIIDLVPGLSTTRTVTKLNQTQEVVE